METPQGELIAADEGFRLTCIAGEIVVGESTQQRKGGSTMQNPNIPRTGSRRSGAMSRRTNARRRRRRKYAPD